MYIYDPCVLQQVYSVYKLGRRNEARVCSVTNLGQLYNLIYFMVITEFYYC